METVVGVVYLVLKNQNKLIGGVMSQHHIERLWLRLSFQSWYITHV